MSSFNKCDKCKKIIKGRKLFRISLTDLIGIFGDTFIGYNYELCEACAKKYHKKLVQIFPEITKKQ